MTIARDEQSEDYAGKYQDNDTYGHGASPPEPEKYHGQILRRRSSGHVMETWRSCRPQSRSQTPERTPPTWEVPPFRVWLEAT